MTSVLNTAAGLETEGIAFALVTVLRTVPPTAANPGDMAAVTPDGKFYGWVGGGCAQRHIVRSVRAALGDGKARYIRVVPEGEVDTTAKEVEEFASYCPSRGTLELFIDPVPARAQLLILGDSPVAATLAALAPQVAFDVFVAATDAVADNYPGAAEVFASFAPEPLNERLRPGAYVVVASQGKLDIVALKTALAVRARHVAFVASERKAAALKEDLRKEGCAGADVDAIEAPAGLDISARTPAEIALSVLAGLVSVRRQGAAERSGRHEARAAAGLTVVANNGGRN